MMCDSYGCEIVLDYGFSVGINYCEGWWIWGVVVGLRFYVCVILW